MSETDKIKWIHLSDLHFGAEKKIPEISTIRQGLLVFLDTIKDDVSCKYFFISGDIFFAPVFYKKNEIEKNEIIEEASSFIIEIMDKLGIMRGNVFIVPGNHDTDRKLVKRNHISISQKEKYIKEITNTTENLNTNELKEYQKDFNKFCENINNRNRDEKIQTLEEGEGLRRIKYCDIKHKFEKREDINVLMLNSSWSSCKDEEEGKLLLSDEWFYEVLNEIEKTSSKNDEIPLFVLSHHAPGWFKKDENNRDILQRYIHDEYERGTVLYLCGHTHNSEVDKYFLVCGTQLAKEYRTTKVKESYKLNKVSFLTGLFDKTLSEATVFFYKWHHLRREWIADRNTSKEHPYFAEKITKDSPKKNILSSKSESEAVNKFFDFIGETLKTQVTNGSKENPCNYLKEEIFKLLLLIKNKRPEWKFYDEYRKKFDIETNKIEDLLKIYEDEHQKHLNVKKEINRKIKTITDRIDNIKTEKGLKTIGILLYSKSMRVTDYVLELLETENHKYKQDIIIYICSGDIRSDNMLYRDALDIASELNRRVKGLVDIQVRLIPDIYVGLLMKREKIQFVLMGAHSLHYDINNFTRFINTTGSNLILNLATEYEVECLIIADISKADISCPDLNSDFYKKIEKVNSFTYTVPTEITNHIETFFHHYEPVDIRKLISKKLITIITDAKEYPWEDLYNIIDYFTNKILKDRRQLVLNDGNATIRKYFLEEDKGFENKVLTTLFENNFSVPEIQEQTKDYIDLNYYKGIRIFNLIVSIDALKNKYKQNGLEYKYKELNDIAEKLLNRCEDNQRKIQLELYNKFKDTKELSKYPQEKLTDMIGLLFSYIKNLDTEIDRDIVMEEMNTVYKHFQDYAIVPFRDASIKNMILKNDDLYLKNFNGDENERNKYIEELFTENKLNSIIDTSDIIDLDFSSCIHLTTTYDDVISFRFHEKTAPYFSFEDIKPWNCIMENKETDTNMLSATLIIRFLRFGGRKLLYRIIAPQLHSKRFKHETESYYFKELQNIISHYNIDLPESMKLFKKIEDILNSGNEEDHFIELDGENIRNKMDEIRRKETYADVFPY
ncbi:MAG: metallophosphoesterase [Bacteroidales bacterium]|nr:metallophosphoesterase [Bacteroidales bacterium]